MTWFTVFYCYPLTRPHLCEYPTGRGRFPSSDSFTPKIGKFHPENRPKIGHFHPENRAFSPRNSGFPRKTRDISPIQRVFWRAPAQHTHAHKRTYVLRFHSGLGACERSEARPRWSGNFHGARAGRRNFHGARPRRKLRLLRSRLQWRDRRAAPTAIGACERSEARPRWQWKFPRRPRWP